MNATMAVMLLWLGTGHGGPVAINGFETVEACKAEMPKVLQAYKLFDPDPKVAVCVELRKR